MKKNYKKGILLLMNRLCIAFIRLYQLCISPLIGPCCRFWPTCSHYAISVLRTQKLHKALWLIVKRLGKCSGYHPGGVDFPPSEES